MSKHTRSGLTDEVVTIRFFVRADDGRIEETSAPAKVYYKNGGRYAFAYHPKHHDRVRFVAHPFIPDAWIPMMEAAAWTPRDDVMRPQVA